jgi:hypothetical protein
MPKPKAWPGDGPQLLRPSIDSDQKSGVLGSGAAGARASTFAGASAGCGGGGDLSSTDGGAGGGDGLSSTGAGVGSGGAAAGA